MAHDLTMCKFKQAEGKGEIQLALQVPQQVNVTLSLVLFQSVIKASSLILVGVPSVPMLMVHTAEKFSLHSSLGSIAAQHWETTRIWLVVMSEPRLWFVSHKQTTSTKPRANLGYSSWSGFKCHDKPDSELFLRGMVAAREDWGMNHLAACLSTLHIQSQLVFNYGLM